MLDQHMMLISADQRVEAQRDQDADRHGHDMDREILQRLDRLFRRVDVQSCLRCATGIIGEMVALDDGS
jgi:hypothetical protein